MRTSNRLTARNKRLLTITTVAASTIISAAALAADPQAALPAFPWVDWGVGILNLVIFLAIIIKFAGPGIQKHFAERRRLFVYNLEEAARLRQEAEARLEEYSARLDSLDRQRQELLEEYHAQGEREKIRIVDAAKKQVEKMRVDAELTIKQDVKKAVADIEQQAVNLAVEMAHKLAQEKLDTAARNRLVDRYVADLGQRTNKVQQTTVI